MTLINLTPHPISIISDTESLDLPPSGEVARVSMTQTIVGHIGWIPIFTTSFGEVTGLPEPQEGVAFIVSGMVASAAPRGDVFSPGQLVRDADGRVVGCKGLTRSV